ncbi:MAG: DUF59 domain-containing protein [Candidatus Doudnabacteria bacterium]|nr:DUF59 domain-containing protein [Candidatus Doudnabacteria bacterium]
MVTRELILKKIGEIPDPDLGISLVDLGLIYKVEVKNDTVEILMTLTTPMCPLAGTLEGQIKEKLKNHKEVKSVKISFTFDPPWTVERISEETKLKLGLLT